MTTINGITATDVTRKAVDYILNHGKKRMIWGGTIPENINDPNSPNDFERMMIELEDPITIVMSDSKKRWTDYSNHATFITLRETEDHLQMYNPGHITKYSKLYNRWLKDNYFNYTYGERILRYPYSMENISGKHKGIGWDFNQLDKAINLIAKNPTTRKACISTWYPPTDLGNPYCPCNTFFQLFERDGLLNWVTVVRSLDVFRGFTENIFMFTMWQEYAAKKLNLDPGAYKTVALNAHLYQDMIDSGHQKNHPPDPYLYYERQNAFDEPFPSDAFIRIDNLLFSDTTGKNHENIIDMCLKLPEYWSNWKLALVAEWYRKHKLTDICFKIVPEITNEFAFSVVRYLKDPESIQLLQSLDQQDYLGKLL